VTKCLHVLADFSCSGDGRVYSIAAASVIAKVTRDRIMVEMHDKWPEYNFASHKGYPTKEHKKAIAEHGPCPIHRMTFKPLKVLVKQLGKRPNQVDVEQG
jgi:ribonuclease HII